VPMQSRDKRTRNVIIQCSVTQLQNIFQRDVWS